jgi:hypothetical protein
VRAAAITLVSVLFPAGAALAADPPPTVHWLRSDGSEVPSDAGLELARTTPPVGDDAEALRVVIASSGAALPDRVTIGSTRAPDAATTRMALDVLEGHPLVTTTCPASLKATQCKATLPFRLVVDEIDRRHPLLAGRSLLAELGGAVTVTAEGLPASNRRVVGAFPRQKAELRVRLVRMLPKGPPPIGRDDEDAVRSAREEIDRATGVWSVCGVSFGPSSKVDVKVVDPPPPFLLSLGCDAPLLALGGELRFSVDAREVVVDVPRGTSPRGAARRAEIALEKLGYRATVSDNRATNAASLASSDVLVMRKDGTPATLAPPKAGDVSSDPALDACIGRVQLDDGLQHFTDADAVAGTLEERTLVKAFDDGDPATIEVIVVPSFGGDARIGESFIFVEHGAVRNVVLEDRAGFRAQTASLTLAHELGHVLLDQPGHPDDFSGDTPTSLMDADAVDATAFGPRRLSASECARAHAQSGPESLARIFQPWPVAPLPTSKKAKTPPR